MLETWHESHDCNPVGRLLNAGYFLVKLFDDQIAATGRVGLYLPRLDDTQDDSVVRKVKIKNKVLARIQSRYIKCRSPIAEFFLPQNATDLWGDIVDVIRTTDPSSRLTQDEENLIVSVIHALNHVLRMNPPVARETDPFSVELRERMNRDTQTINGFAGRLEELRALLRRHRIRFDMQTYRIQRAMPESSCVTNEVTREADLPKRREESQPTSQSSVTLTASETDESQAETLFWIANPLPMPDDLYERVQKLTPFSKEAYRQFWQAQQILGKGAGVTACYRHIVEVCKEAGKEFEISLKTWTQRVNRGITRMSSSKPRGPKMERLTDVHQDGLSDNPEDID